MRTQRFSSLLAAFAISACNAPAEEGTVKSDEPTGKTEDAERIDSANDPNRFSLNMTRSYVGLPTSGESLRKPFPSNWWPMKEAGIAREWIGGQKSPAGKYDQLVTPTEIKSVQLTLAKKDWEGNDVNENADPVTLTIGPAEEWEHKNHGRYGRTDPEHWWGHCNGWASYVINEEEPIRPVSVKYNAANRGISECANATDAGCVTFELGDINALGAELYWNDGARLLGRRCEEIESEFEFDESGRVTSVECRDGNAGAFHIVAANMLGRLERPFIVDLNADRQVWNYPVYKFELLKNERVTVQQALQEIGAPAGTNSWIYNEDAKSFVSVRMKAWIVEDAIPPSSQPAGDLLARYTTIEYYTYILELDAAGNIIGGEYTGVSKTKHPDFLWYSFSNTAYAASSDDLFDGDNPKIRYTVFKQILTLSQNPRVPTGGGGNTITVSSTPNAAIPDNNTTGVSNTLRANGGGNVSSVTVNVSITHTYRGDLTVTLSHGGRTATLHSQAGGSADNLSLSVVTNDFNGVAAAGDWTLKVVDGYAQDTGSLASWGLSIATGAGGGTDPDPDPNPTSHKFSASPGVAIPDNNATGASSAINVADAFNTSSVKVTLDITHTYRGDLIVTLAHGGKTATLHNRAGGGADNLRQTYELNDFNGIGAKGSWTLKVADRAGQDVGTLNSWQLEISEGAGGGGNNGGGNNPPDSVTRTFAGTGGQAIPDNNATGVAATLTVSESIRIESVRVELNVTHTYISDLKVVLEKNGVTQTLHDRQGGSDDNINRTFETLGFGNGNAQGTWTLRISDHARLDTGTLDGWKLIVTGVPQ